MLRPQVRRDRQGPADVGRSKKRQPGGAARGLPSRRSHEAAELPAQGPGGRIGSLRQRRDGQGDVRPRRSAQIQLDPPHREDVRGHGWKLCPQP